MNAGSLLFVACLAAAFSGLAGCGQRRVPTDNAGADPNVTTLGTVEVTARLVEVPEGAIFRRELYDYATVLKYEVVAVHRGKAAGVIYVGHYNPFKPRREAADRHVRGIGGNLRAFRAGDYHRMALDAPIDAKFMGGIVNKYFGRCTEPIYWALWTNSAK
jgi:hypothetical protein